MFISHSEKDRWIAEQIANLIGKSRVRTFLYEKDVQGGQSIPDTIRAHIEECNEFLVLLSRYSVSRPWVLSELGAAWGLRKPIVAIVDKIGPKEMPDIIFPYKAIDLNGASALEFLRLRKSTPARIGRPVSEASWKGRMSLWRS